MAQPANLDSTQSFFKKIIFEIIFIIFLILIPLYTSWILNKGIFFNDLILFFISIFLLSFLASILAPQFSLIEIILFSAILPATIFITYFKKLPAISISLGFFVFWFLISLALFLSKKEEERSIAISFSRIFKTFWNWFFLGIFLFSFIIFFFQNPQIQEGKFFLSLNTVQKGVNLVSPFIKELDKDFDPQKTLKDYLQNKKINILGIDINLPIKESVEEFNKKTGLKINENDSLGFVLASFLINEYEKLNFSHKRIIFISLVLILLFIYESVVVFLGSLLSFLANIFFWLFSILGIVNIRTEPRGKEKIKI